MSLYLESPLSDSKMDISDATTSLDSTGVSPIAEDDDDPAIKVQSPPSHENHNEEQRHAPTAAKQDTQNEDDHSSGVHTSADDRLDNRIEQPEVQPLLDPTPLTLRNNIARTLANSHPLMSPTGTGTDSDCSEQNHAQAQSAMDLQCHNFPDVVPHSERLQQSLPPHLAEATASTTAPSAAVSARNTLNSIRGRASAVAQSAPAHNKLSLLRAHSPDLLSSESDADISQYHAAVKANFQAVALIPNLTNGTAVKEMRRGRKTTNGCAAGAGCDDISSLDSISNHSFDDDEDLEHNLASLSPSSSLIDGLDDEDDDDDCEGPEVEVDDDDRFPDAITPTPTTSIQCPVTTTTSAPGATVAATTTATLPQYSAAEERRDSRNWQKITLPDGRTREIDMRVIEPYKRVLSHGGYLKAGGHNAIVIFCACHLPDRSRADYNYVMDNLFLYVVKTLEQLVTEDYVLIYLHGGTNRRNVPPFPWLKKCYQLLDRRLRKSLKNMYLVHPTFWIKSIVWMARPFVSAKFWRKLIYVKSLEELGTHVAVEKAAIPEKVKQYDAKHN